MSATQSYVPSAASPSAVIQSLGDFSGLDIALNGAWSPTIFYQDLKNHPVKDKKELAELVYQACRTNMPYLEFFEKSRGYSRVVNDIEKQLWDTFERGSVMLYFEPIFLHLLQFNEMNSEYNVLIAYVDAMSRVPVNQWNPILKGIGACCYQFFAKESSLYAKLPYRTRDDIPEEMTDEELLNALDCELSPEHGHGKISIEDSRTALVQKYKSQYR